MAKRKNRHQTRCSICGRFAANYDVEVYGSCFDCGDPLLDAEYFDDHDDEDELNEDEPYDDDPYDFAEEDWLDEEEDLDEDELDSDDVGRTLLEQGCALTEDERQAFGISETEYINRMMRP